MTRTEEFIRDLMADRDPAADTEVPTRDRRYAAQRLQAAMADTATDEGPGTFEGSGSWWPRRRPVVATVVVGVLAVVAALVVSPGAVLDGDGGSGRAYAATPPLLMTVDQPGASAEQTLEELADASDQQAGLGDGEYRHLRTASWYLHTTVSDGQGESVIVPSIIEKWLAPDGSGVVAEARGEPVEAGPPGRLADEQARRQLPDGYEVTQRSADGAFSWDVDGLPTDPDALHDVLMDAYNGGLPEHVYLYRSLTDRLIQQRLEPDLLAAYYRMLADLPQMREYGTVVDRAGREGVAVGFDSSVGGLPSRDMLIIDQDTGTPLGVEDVLTTDAGKLGVRIPAVIGYAVFLAGGRVDSTDVPGPDIP